MKKLFIFYIIVMSMILGCNSANAMGAGSIRSYVYCVEGYKFIYTHTSSTYGGVTVTQVLEYSAHVGMVPLSCDGSEPYRVAYEGIKTKK